MNNEWRKRQFIQGLEHAIRQPAIIAAVLELGCHTIYSEDLNDGQDYGGVTAVNPFK